MMKRMPQDEKHDPAVGTLTSRPAIGKPVGTLTLRPAISTLKRRQSIQDISAKAATSGTAGAIAMGSNVMSLMWIRSVMKYQYANGGSFVSAFKVLYKEGGIARLYRGLPFALIQAPLCRFGDAAANTFVLTLLNDSPKTEHLHVGVKTCAATIVASGFRIVLMPLDTSMTTMQVRGSIRPLVEKVQLNGMSALFQGSVSAASASIVGFMPWFYTYNLLSERTQKRESVYGELTRRGGIGFVASVVSDTMANLFWVVKVNKQTAGSSLSYPQVVQKVTRESGLRGLLFRGLETKILANGLQGFLFSILWQSIEEKLGT